MLQQKLATEPNSALENKQCKRTPKNTTKRK